MQVGLPIGIGWWDAEELDADTGVASSRKLYTFRSGSRCHDRAQLAGRLHVERLGDHLARQHPTQVADVEFTAGRDAGVDQMVGTLFNEVCPDDVGPVDHVFTSDGNGSMMPRRGTLSISFRMVLLTSTTASIGVLPASRTASMVLDMTPGTARRR